MTLSVKRLSAVLAAALISACTSGRAAPASSSAAAGGPPQPPGAAHDHVRQGLPRWLNAQRSRGHHNARRPHHLAKNP